MKNIEELRAELLEIGERIGGGVRPNHYFTIPDRPDGMATPYLETYGEEYHFIINERGTEIERKVTLSDDVEGLASSYAALTSSPEREFRDIYFRRQYSLMLAIKPEWATRKRKKFTEILRYQLNENS